MPHREASLGYQLPAAIESIKDGWQKTCQTGAVFSSLFTVLAIMMLSLVKGSGLLDHQPREKIQTFLALVSYGALFFNLSASVSGFVLIDQVGLLLFQAGQMPSELLPTAGHREGGTDFVSRPYGVGKFWRLLIVHWFCCYVTGIWCIVLEMLVYLWLSEPTVVRVFMLMAGGYSLIPLIAFVSPLWKTITGQA